MASFTLLLFSGVFRRYIMGTLARNELAKCHIDINPVSANPTKLSDTLIRRQKPTNCLGVTDHFMELALKRLNMGQRPGYSK